MILEGFLIYVVTVVGLVVGLYVIVRSTSFAYYRSKYEHFRMIDRMKKVPKE